MIRLEQDIVTVDKHLIEQLVAMAGDQKNGRCRAVVGNEDSPVQEMFIALLKESYIRPHRHPEEKSESYTLIAGQLLVNLYKNDGTLHRVIDVNPYYRQKGGWYHQPVAVSDWVVYKETYSGKWRKDKDVEYASWAPEEK